MSKQSSFDLMLVMEATAGGTARYLEEVVPGLLGHGFSVHVVCSFRRDPSFRLVADELRVLGAHVTEVDMSVDSTPSVI